MAVGNPFKSEADELQLRWRNGIVDYMWTIDQMVRALTGSDYANWVAEFKNGEDGPETYEWDEGIAP